MKFGFHSSLCTIPICLSQEEPHVLLVFLDKISICTLIYLFVSSLQGVCALNVMQKSAKRISFFFFLSKYAMLSHNNTKKEKHKMF